MVTRAEEHRERLEVMELLDRATPDEIKSGGLSDPDFLISDLFSRAF